MVADIYDFPICRRVEERVRTLVEAERQSDAHRIDHLHRVARDAKSICEVLSRGKCRDTLPRGADA